MGSFRNGLQVRWVDVEFFTTTQTGLTIWPSLNELAPLGTFEEILEKPPRKTDSDEELKPESIFPFNLVIPSNLEKSRDKHTVVRKSDFAAHNRIGRDQLISK